MGGKMNLIAGLSLLGLLIAAMGQAAEAEDSSAIRETAGNYMAAWYHGDTELMKQSLYKKLAKRNVKRGYGDTRVIGVTSRADMLSYTRGGYGKRLWEEGMKIRITVLDQHDNIASVKVVTPHYYEYLHLAKTGNGWVIVNTLYE